MFDTTRVDEPGAVAGLVLERTDPAALGDLELIAYTRAAERQASHAQAVALRAVALLADRAETVAAKADETVTAARCRRRGLDAPDPDELAARAGIDQVRQTLRLSAVAAGNRIELARAVTRGPLTALGNALTTGEVTLSHARVGLAHTEGRDPDLVRDMLTRTLPRAAEQTPGDFGKALARAEHALDPVGAAGRAREAVKERTGVHHRANPDSTGTLSLTASEPETEWAFTVLDTLARAELHGHGTLLADSDGTDTQSSTGGAVDNSGFPPLAPPMTPTIAADAARDADVVSAPPLVRPHPAAGPAVDNSGVPANGTATGSPTQPPTPPRQSLPWLRAQVLLRLLEKAAADTTFPTTHGRRRVETQVVLTLDTLLGLKDDPACINGRPVPGPIARELASNTSTLRRLVTDPVQGHLLDYGAAFPIPQALTEFVLARDRTCRVPGCNLPAVVTDLDHAIPREQDGASSSENLGALCRSHHTLKTAGLTDVQDSRADGSATYVTVLGERIQIPARPLLEPPAYGAPPPPSIAAETDQEAACPF
jgi:hypothetical protein